MVTAINPTLDEKIEIQKYGIRRVVEVKRWADKTLPVMTARYRTMLKERRQRNSNNNTRNR